VIYRKRGSVARWENGTLVRTIEQGIAIERGEWFECRPESRGDVQEVDPSHVIAVAHAVRGAARDSVIERLIVSDGFAEHECSEREDSEPRRWSERAQRLHLSLVHHTTRALLDLGSFDLDLITRVATSLARSETRDRHAPPRLRLAPHVTAALLPSLLAIAPPNVRLVQTAGGIDGHGHLIVEAIVKATGEASVGSAGAWPNVYRPSYRMRPVRMPLDVRIECEVQEIERERPEAVAMLGAPLMEGGLVVRLLIEEGERVYPAAVRIARIDAVSASRTWYPYAGGSFGAEMML